MDLLFKRYASPFVYLDSVICTERFAEFVDEFLTITNAEREEKSTWEFYLHKTFGFDGSYNDFVEQIKTDKQNQNLSAVTIETTVKDALNILDNFTPN